MSAKYDSKWFIDTAAVAIRHHLYDDMAKSLGGTPSWAADDPVPRKYADALLTACFMGFKTHSSSCFTHTYRVDMMLNDVFGYLKVEFMKAGLNFHHTVFVNFLVQESMGGESIRDHYSWSKPLCSALLPFAAPNTLGELDWKDLEFIHDDHGNLKLEYGGTSCDWDPRTSRINDHLKTKKKTVREVLNTDLPHQLSSCATRDLWWDNLIGPEIRKRICRF